MKIWSAEIKDLESLSTLIKGRFPDLEKEMERLIKADDENMILLYSRRCLEVIITELCERELKRPRKTEPLQGIIDRLHKEEKVPSHIIASMQSLNSLSTFGAHPKDFDTEQIKPVLNNLDIIIKWYMKYKETGEEIKAKPAEVIRQEIKSTGDVKKDITISRKRLAGLLSGSIAIIASVFAVLYFSRIIDGRKQTRELEKSIAVLPFDNMSTNAEQIWFGDAMTDEIIMQLYKVKAFIVRSRTSVLQYKGNQKTIPEIGKELNVNYLIEGSAQRFDDQVRIRVQLINAVTDDHIWGDTYEGTWKDIMSFQSEIAKQIAGELKTVLTPEEKEQIEKSQTTNSEAYNLYLQGRFYWNKRTEDGLKKSVEYFEKSIAEDPDYALAYAGLADAYFIQAYWGWIPWNGGTAKSKEVVLRALEIDKKLAEAHTVLGALLNYKDWKWEEARKELQLAIELNPNFVTAHHYYSELLDILRENTEARKQINLALKIDPFLPVLRALSAGYYYREGKFKESFDEFQKLIELDPEYRSRSFRFTEFKIHLKQNNEMLALAALKKALFTDTLSDKNSDIMTDIYNNSGIEGLLNWLIELELTNLKQGPVFLANWYVMAGKKEEALDCLEKALKDPPVDFHRINNSPDFDILRSEPRFQVIIRKMGLSEYQNLK